jgi:hypothetical protein
MLHPEFPRTPDPGTPRTRTLACSALAAMLLALAAGPAHADGDCRQRAVSGAVRMLDQPLVTGLHLRRTGAAPARTGAWAPLFTTSNRQTGDTP